MQKFLLIIFMLFCLVHKGTGQNNVVDSLRLRFDQSYGMDAILVNGKRYFPESNPVTGNPFWKSQDAFTGTITIFGRRYTGQQLKYDLHKQQFILVYSNYNEQQNQIILNTAAIDSVNIGNCLFIANKNPAIRQPFVQLISSGKLTCTVVWIKEFNFISAGQKVGYVYSDAYFQHYLNYKGSETMFKNKSSFLHIFNRKERAPIRKYIASRGLIFKKMDDNELRKLISFCEQTIN